MRMTVESKELPLRQLPFGADISDRDHHVLLMRASPYERLAFLAPSTNNS